MSTVKFTKDDHRNGSASDDGDIPIDFCNLNSSLHRPSDHYRIASRGGTNSTTLNNPGSSSNPYAPPPRSRQSFAPHRLAAQFIRDPVTMTLSSFSKVANLVWTPHDEDGDCDSAFDLLGPPTSSAAAASPSDAQFRDEVGRVNHDDSSNERDAETFKHPPPALPPIQCSQSQNRLPTLSQEEYESKWASSSPEDLLKRIFQGGIGDNDLRRRLWPLILGLTKSHSQDFAWDELESTYELYENQWKAILPDQETRFTAYRERKSILERDVVRCDRSHPFYKDDSENLEKLRIMIMTYIMYDFDTGYVQGMTDLAAPLLYVWNGDVKKAFWCFVKVMELFKRNFEMSQSTISFQLKMLWKLIETTDPCFAQYLASNESQNCYFSFRWIICQFKREFMKGKTDGYDDCLNVWETIWAANALCEARVPVSEAAEVAPQQGAQEPEAPPEASPAAVVGCRSAPGVEGAEAENESVRRPCDLAGSIIKSDKFTATNDDADNHKQQLLVVPATATATGSSTVTVAENSTSVSVRDQQASPSKLSTNGDSLTERLKDIELFTLCVCLSIIRRERDLIMANEYDACEILKHFNTLQLNDDLSAILRHASSIWSWIKHDGGEEQLYANDSPSEEKASGGDDNAAAEDGFDLLNDDFMMLTNAALNV